LIRFLVAIAIGFDKAVTWQRIGGDCAAGFNMVQNKRFKRICRTVQGNVQTNATHPFLKVSALDSNGDNGFTMGTTASRT
jgi:hypothetical protein